ncbi:Lysine exporter protein [Photorhabdus asymbiotica]|uniref:Lysine exporter protein n=2 Tax=Photorhabdus asymbiotica TaxID=291112 RepID=C7BK21_PHOAA|nr:LysE family transporter [Photorhabdus asymbiotica]RKS65856.1 L-lysine exporter family protein LysE/ArgO [Photorhabdus asymbiotica]CAQ84261.1 Lysine exporter protein [Photorhabdus asymbiotica]
MLALINGFILCLGLVISIGPQNIEILRVGLLNDRVVLLASVFVVCDAILITIGALGVGSIIALNREITMALMSFTIVFLLFLALQAGRRSMRKSEVVITFGERQNTNASGMVKRGLVLSFLNPLALLETIVILGSTAAPYPVSHRILFVAGALAASSIWFYGLAYSSHRLSALISQPWQHRIIEAVVAVTLFITACWLLQRTFII